MTFERRNQWHVGRMAPRLAPTETPTLYDIYWAAGIFEGEGHPRRSTTTETVVVGQAGSSWLPDRLRALFGGSVNPHTPKNRRHKTAYWWVISGARARGFMQTIYGLVSPRRQTQIRQALGK